MDEIKEIVLTASTALIIGEIIYFLTPRDKLTDCIYGLIYTVIIVTSILSLTKTDFDINFEQNTKSYQYEIDSFISDMVLVETEEELKKIVSEALDTVHIECRSLDFTLSMNENEEVMVEKFSVTVNYKADVENATVILGELFGDAIQVEVHGEE